MNFKIYLQSPSWIAQGWQEENEGKTEIKKSEFLEKEKSFLDQIKSIF